MSAKKQKFTTLIYRGTGENRGHERMGAWWSTDPYYSLRYADGGKGQFFVAQVDDDELTKHANIASIDEGYEIYIFPMQDPTTARLATAEEIEALRSEAIIDNPTDLPGGPLLRRPSNSVEIGYRIFAPQAIGATATNKLVHPLANEH